MLAIYRALICFLDPFCYFLVPLNPSISVCLRLKQNKMSFLLIVPKIESSVGDLNVL